MIDSTDLSPSVPREWLDSCVRLLAELIGYRTVNPGGDELTLCRRLARELSERDADEVEVIEVPRPGRETGGYVYARYGTPTLLINVHLDTVPANTGWTRDPWTAHVDGDRVYGLGSADTKGAIAAVLVALSHIRPKNVGVLFSGDEESGTHCVNGFVNSERISGIRTALVCEPTARCAGVRHRGVRACRAEVRGRGGHSSKADFMPKPVVTMARLALALDDLGQSYLDQGPADMKGICMNVAALEGGVAFNVVPDSAALTWSIRQPPGFATERFERQVSERIAAIDPAITWTTSLAAEPFSCRDKGVFEKLLGDGRVRGFVPLDFWTEAALFSARGVNAVVIGPGDIAQAHSPDEFVTIADLAWAIELFTHVLSSHE